MILIHVIGILCIGFGTGWGAKEHSTKVADPVKVEQTTQTEEK